MGPGRMDPRSVLVLISRSLNPLPLCHILWACFRFLSSSSIMLASVRVPLQTLAVTFGLFSLLLPVQAYIPAVPTNDTAVTFANGTTVTESSRLVIEWYSLE